MKDELWERGDKMRRKVLGDEHVERSQSARSAFNEDFTDLLTRYGWGEIWGRPGLDLKTRSCITLAMLVALGREEELVIHLRGALNNGVTRDEIKEVLLQAAVYCGLPAGNSAFRIAAQVLS